MFLLVSDSVNRGRVCLNACWDTTTPPSPPGSRHHPRADPPQKQTHTPGSRHLPPPGSRLRHTVNERPVRILLECILVSICACSNWCLSWKVKGKEGGSQNRPRKNFLNMYNSCKVKVSSTGWAENVRPYSVPLCSRMFILKVPQKPWYGVIKQTFICTFRYKNLV